MGKRVFGLAMLIGLLGITPGYGMDDYDLVLRVRDLALKTHGAAKETKARLYEREGKTLVGSTVDLTSGLVWTVSSDVMHTGAYYFVDGVGEGSESKPSRAKKYLDTDVAEHDEMGYITEIPGIEYPIWIEILKNYQDVEMQYILFVGPKDIEILDQVRADQKVSVTFQITGLRIDSASSAGVDNEHEVYGRILSVNPEVTMVSCENGHEFAPTSGFRFCPRCGKPLE